MENQKPIKIAIASQKGGSGKSTLTMLLANKLFFEKKKKVLILDCDERQNCCWDVRESENQQLRGIQEKKNKGLAISLEDRTLWKLFSKSYANFPNVKKDFQIIVPSVDRAKDSDEYLDGVIKQLPKYENMHFDIILFDTVGTISKDGKLISLMSEMDYIFVPIETENQAIKPAITSLTTFLSLSEKHSGKVFGFLNKHKPHEKNQQRCLLNLLAAASQFNLSLLWVPGVDGELAFASDRAIYREPLVKSSLIPSTYTKGFSVTEGNELLEIFCSKIL